MKLMQLDDLARVRPHWDVQKILRATNALMLGGFLYAINNNEYCSAGHTNAYNHLMGYAAMMMFTLGAGGLYGLQMLKFSSMPSIGRERIN